MIRVICNREAAGVSEAHVASSDEACRGHSMALGGHVRRFVRELREV